MTKFESKVKLINKNQDKLYNFLSDFKNFEKFIPKEKVKDIQIDSDGCTFTVDMLGKVDFRIIERDPSKTIKFGGDSKMPFNFWIQLKDKSESESYIKLTLKAELPKMVKLMAKGKIEKGINELADKMAEVLNQIPL